MGDKGGCFLIYLTDIFGKEPMESISKGEAKLGMCKLSIILKRTDQMSEM